MRKFLWVSCEKFATIVRVVDRAVAIVKEYDELFGHWRYQARANVRYQPRPTILAESAYEENSMSLVEVRCGCKPPLALEPRADCAPPALITQLPTFPRVSKPAAPNLIMQLDFMYAV